MRSLSFRGAVIVAAATVMLSLPSVIYLESASASPTGGVAPAAKPTSKETSPGRNASTLRSAFRRAFGSDPNQVLDVYDPRFDDLGSAGLRRQAILNSARKYQHWLRKNLGTVTEENARADVAIADRQNAPRAAAQKATGKTPNVDLLKRVVKWKHLDEVAKAQGFHRQDNLAKLEREVREYLQKGVDRGVTVIGQYARLTSVAAKMFQQGKLAESESVIQRRDHPALIRQQPRQVRSFSFHRTRLTGGAVALPVYYRTRWRPDRGACCPYLANHPSP